MISQVLSFSFLRLILVAAIIYFLFYLAIKYYWKDTYTVKADYFRVPTSNTLTVLGLLLPVLSAAAAYLYTKDPNSNITWLLASVTVLGFTLIVAIWVTFSIFKKVTAEDMVELKIPDDLRFIVAMALMYCGLIIGISYVAGFFLFGLAPPQSMTMGETVKGSATYLEKPRFPIGASCADIRKLWGEPVGEDPGRRSLEYRTTNSSIILVYDSNCNLQKITEERR